MWPLWLIVAGLCFVLEIYTVGFFIFLFGIGALVALVVSLFTPNLFIQIVTFLVTSILLLPLSKPLTKKLTRSAKTTQTNYHSIINKQGIVSENIDCDNATGQIKVKGEVWSAIADTNIKKGEKIRVIEIDGVKAKVEKLEKV